MKKNMRSFQTPFTGGRRTSGRPAPFSLLPAWLLVAACLLPLISAPLCRAAGEDTEPTAGRSSFTITEAISTALVNSPDLQSSMARIRQAEAGLARARAPFWPRLSVYSEYVRADAPSSYLFKTIDARSLAPDTNFNEPGILENFESGVKVDVNLYKGGQDLLQQRIAKTHMGASRYAHRAVRNTLVLSVIQTYYNVLAAADFIEIASQTKRTVERQLEDRRIRYEGGSVLRSEVLSLKARLAQAEADLLQAKNRFQLMLATLNKVLGSALPENVILNDSGWSPPPCPGSYAKTLALALERRPERARVKETVAAAELARRKARAAYLPTANAQARWYVDDEAMEYDRHEDNWSLGLVLNWELFSGFSTEAGIARAEALEEEGRATLRRVEQEIELDVKSSYLLLSEAKSRLEVAILGNQEAEEAFRLVSLEYEGGSASVVRFLNAELALQSARIAETTARYDVKKAQADLCRAMGCFADDDSPVPPNCPDS